MRKEEITIYKIDELSEEARKFAIDTWNEHGLDHVWWIDIYDDFKAIADLMGITVKDIYFTGFYSQGDGASFTGLYTFEENAPNEVRNHAPKDKELHNIVDALTKEQKDHDNNLNAIISRDDSNYYHENSVNIELYVESEDSETDYFTDEHIESLFRDLMRWLYKQLEQEYTYMTSDEAVIETLRINDYEFTQDGKRY